MNWVFGDTLASYVSGAEGYVVANAAVSSPAPTVLNLTVTAAQAGGLANNLTGVAGDAAPGFPGGSFAAAAIAVGQKSELYFDPVGLFGRTVRIGEVKSMSYWTKKGTTHISPNEADWFLAIYTQPFTGDVSTPTWYGSRFGSEPYFSINLADPAITWNQWTTDGANNQLRFFESTAGALGANFGAYTDPVWGGFLGFPGGNSLGTTVPRRNQEVLFFSIQTGSAWANGFTGQLDGFKIELANGSVATINFELEDDAPVAYDTTVTPGAVAVTSLLSPITVTAVIDDTLTGGSIIKSAEFSVDESPTWLPMGATNSPFDSSSESVTATFTLTSAGISTPGVYSVCVRGYDASDNVSNEDCTLLAVYDPSAGFVTGGGWIYSEPGAMPFDPSAEGKANFGFVSKYLKGKTVPTGTTEFVFTAGDINFHSSLYEWLIVNQTGTNAQFKGHGTINSAGNYGFMLWAKDGAKTATADTFRIRIWDKDNADAIVYDNGDQAIEGGNIMIHVPKK